MKDAVSDSLPPAAPGRRVSWEARPGKPALRLHVPSAEVATDFGVASEPERLRKRLARRVARRTGVMLGVYWAAAFAATHVPMPPGNGPGPFGIPHFDKLVHFGIYAGLAFLLTAWLAVRQRFEKAVLYAVVVAVVLATYGAVDEISQSPVGRTTDLFDWLADVTGLGFGLAAFFAVRAWVWRERASVAPGG